MQRAKRLLVGGVQDEVLGGCFAAGEGAHSFHFVCYKKAYRAIYALEDPDKLL